MIAPGCLLPTPPLPRHAPFATSLATAAPFWSWLAVAAQRGLRRQNDVKISKFRVLGQQIACDYRYSRLINVVEQTATAHQDGAWLRMCRKHHRMRRQAFCSFSPLLIGTFAIEARVCFGCLSFQLRDGTVRKQLKCTGNRTNKQTNMQFPSFPSPHAHGEQLQQSRQKARRACGQAWRGGRQGRAAEMGEFRFKILFLFLLLFLGSSHFFFSFFSATAGSNCCLSKVHLKPPTSPASAAPLCIPRPVAVTAFLGVAIKFRTFSARLSARHKSELYKRCSGRGEWVAGITGGRKGEGSRVRLNGKWSVCWRNMQANMREKLQKLQKWTEKVENWDSFIYDNDGYRQIMVMISEWVREK